MTTRERTHQQDIGRAESPLRRACASMVLELVMSLMFIDGVVVDDGTPQINPARFRAGTGTASRPAIRLVVKSKRRLVRDAMCAYLAGQPEFTVVGQTSTIGALGELCQLRRPEVALVDTVELSVAKVSDLARVHAAAPGVELVVTYADASPQALQAAVAAGITALMPCTRGLEAILRRVRDSARPGGRRQPDGVALSEYDMRILSLMSSGHSVAAMARLLQVSPRTVENHRRRLYMKLDVGNSGHAVARAISMGLVDSPDQNGQARYEERGHGPLVLVRGRPGSILDAVRCALLAAQIAFVHVATPAPLHQEHWVRWQRGPIVAVLIDPTYDDWLVPVGVTTRIVVVLSGDADLPTFVDVLLCGAHALLRGHDVAEDLAAILPAVAHGYLAVDATHLDDIAGWMAIRMVDGSPAVPALTAREGDILGSIAAGHSIRQTARMLGIAAKTVENTQARLYRKLGARNRAEALTIAHRLGLLDSRPEPA